MFACLHSNWPRVERAAQPPRLHHFLGEDRAEGGSSSHRHNVAKASASGGGKERISGCAQVNKELHKPHLPSILPGNAKGQSERGGGCNPRFHPFGASVSCPLPPHWLRLARVKPAAARQRRITGQWARTSWMHSIRSSSLLPLVQLV